MRILHTSDWHLGKTLEGYSRLEEQEMFLDELTQIVEEKNVDLILIAGDIYDNSNPPAQAERLFYNTLKRLSKKGERAVLVIAGNHDNPERLMAANPLAYDHGVILLGKPKSTILPGKYGSFEVVEAGEGFVKIELRGEKAVLITLPYPSEKRLNEIITLEGDEESRRKSYSDRVGEFFQKLSTHYGKDTINLAVSHLYLKGGEESDSERQIQLGGSLAVDPSVLPAAQYIALGHLHRPQRVGQRGRKAFYSGSPLQYSRNEVHYSKCVYILDVKPGEEAQVEEVYLRNYKPIEVWECNSIEDALQKCRDNQEGERWVYLDIKTDRVLTQAEIKEMKELRKDIVQIRPIFMGKDDADGEKVEDYMKLKTDQLFKAFYQSRRGTEAPDEIMKLFYEIAEEEGGEDAASPIED